MDGMKGYQDALHIPDESLKGTAQVFIDSVAEAGILYGRSADRQAIVNNGGNDPLGG